MVKALFLNSQQSFVTPHSKDLNRAKASWAEGLSSLFPAAQDSRTPSTWHRQGLLVSNIILPTVFNDC